MLRTRKKKTKREGEQKPVIVHTKRKQVVDEEGWTHVVDKPQRPTTKPKPTLHAGDFEINGVSYIEKTVDELKRDYEFWLKQWRETGASKELETILHEKKEKLVTVENVVVLGLGSMQSARREGRRSSATQLAALQTVIDVLGGSANAIFQDPQYTELDGKFLESLGYKVVKDPEAFGTISQNTLVFAVHCYKEVYGAVAAQEQKPAVFIGTDIGNFGRFDTSGTTDNILTSLEALVEGCETLDFPQILGRHDFSDTKIYWRKEVSIQNIAAGIANVEENLAENDPIKSEEDTRPTEPLNVGEHVDEEVPTRTEGDSKTDDSTNAVTLPESLDELSKSEEDHPPAPSHDMQPEEHKNHEDLTQLKVDEKIVES